MCLEAGVRCGEAGGGLVGGHRPFGLVVEQVSAALEQEQEANQKRLHDLAVMQSRADAQESEVEPLSWRCHSLVASWVANRAGRVVPEFHELEQESFEWFVGLVDEPFVDGERL